jgi:N6-L-threonylcarbamoyladenine synthase
MLQVRKSQAAGDFDSLRADIAASFQKAAVDTLVGRTLKAAKDQDAASVVVAGGVGANSCLRAELRRRFPGRVYYPRAEFCTDNGAMIAFAGAMRLADAASPDTIQARARWDLDSLSPPHSQQVSQ